MFQASALHQENASFLFTVTAKDPTVLSFPCKPILFRSPGPKGKSHSGHSIAIHVPQLLPQLMAASTSKPELRRATVEMPQVY